MLLSKNGNCQISVLAVCMLALLMAGAPCSACAETIGVSHSVQDVLELNASDLDTSNHQDSIEGDGAAADNLSGDVEASADSVVPEAAAPAVPILSYRAHVQNKGWMNYVKAGKVAGTTGKSLNMEALKVRLKANDVLLGSDAVSVEVHVAGIGWVNAVGNDALAGTTGRSKAIEAVRIRLSDELSSSYSIWYRVHSANFGWLDWACDGAEAGSAGYARGVQAIEICLAKKGEQAPGKTDVPFYDRKNEPPSISYKAHVSNIGWKALVSNGAIAGATSESNAIEAISCSLNWYGHKSSAVELRGHVQGVGWQGWTKGTAGTTGKGRRLEAIQARVVGDAAESYDLWYRVYSRTLGGWLGWTHDGLSAGSAGKAAGIQGIQFLLINKGASAPGSCDNSFVGLENIVKAQGFVGKQSVSATAKDGLVTIQDRSGKALSDISVALENQTIAGSMMYDADLQLSGWTGSWATNGARVHRAQDGMSIKSIKLKLDGAIAATYDIWYRVCDAEQGWLDWTSNGAPAGNANPLTRVTGVQLQLLPQGADAPGSTDRAFIPAEELRPFVAYQAHVSNYGWLAPVADGAIAGTTGKSLSLQAVNAVLEGVSTDSSLQMRTYVVGIGWMDWKSGSYAGTVGQNRAVEAVSLKLEGSVACDWDIYYRLHVSGYGWLGWAKNGEDAGSTALSAKAEAIQIQLIKKGDAAPESQVPAFLQAASVSLCAHVQNIGWQKPVGNDGTMGTTGRALRIEAFTAQWNGPVLGGIEYASHVQNQGWQNWVADGATSGSVGLSRRVEAVMFRLTGDASSYYDIWYRAHVQGVGWLGWAKNGSKAGSEGASRRIEAIQVKVLPKNAPAPGSQTGAFMDAASFDTVLGVPRVKILTWLNRHRYDNYYLGTPFTTFPSGFSPESCMYPNGSRRWDGFAGQNCAGFVAHVYRSAGGNLAPIGANNSHSPWAGGPGRGGYANAWRWYGYAIDSGAHVYTFNTVRQMLASGVAKKGDIIFFKTAPSIDCHIGIFWGDSPSDNKIWHQILPKNTISAIFNNANKNEVSQQVCILR